MSRNFYGCIKKKRILDEYTLKLPVAGLYGGYTTACLLAVKNKSEYKFDNKRRSSIVVNKRYIEGTLSVEESKIECFFAYVPDASKGTSYYINRKGNMLNGIIDFLRQNENEDIFVAGDLNTDLFDKNGKCQEEFKHIFNSMQDTVIEKYKDKPTWNCKRLDYALVSKSLKDKYICETEYVDDSGSDHKGLLTTITMHGEMV